MEQAKRLFKNKLFLIALLAVLVGGGYYIYKSTRSSEAAPQYVTMPVQKGTITASVSGTGQVAAESQVTLKARGSGKITSLNMESGQTVKEGDVLATLDQRSTSNQIQQAQVSLAQAQADYDKLVAGATDSDLLSSQLSLESAQQSLDRAKRNYDTTVAEQQQIVDRARTNLLNSGIEAVPSNTISTATLELSGTYTGTEEGKFTIILYNTGNGLYYQSSGLGSEFGPVNRGLKVPLGSGLYATFSTSGILDSSTIWTIDVPNKTTSAYTTNLQAYNSALLDQTKNIQSAQDSIASAENSVKQAQAQLNDKLTPAAAPDIAAAKAKIDSARLTLSQAQQAYADNIIKAPFDGIIANVSAQKGDDVSSGTELGTIITKQKIAEISLNEVDVASVKPGQKVMVTFDAIDGLTSTGQVVEVDAVGTATQGVVNYNIKISLDTQDERVKPGMSVSANIITDIKQDVLYVPNSAIKTRGENTYVQTLVGGSPQDHTVQTGLVNDTYTEVSGDIQEGDTVITQTITSQSSSQTTNQPRTGGGLPGIGGGFTGGGTMRIMTR